MMKQALPLLFLFICGSLVTSRPQEGSTFFDSNPEYQFEYQVSSNLAKTYMSHRETRNGDFVNGEYTYVDPNGSLVIVSYEAGPKGYRATKKIERGFLARKRSRSSV
uniref:Uncharacterized protein n=1 Tax=Lepeophtheirus salmonis TaxID=72036 RepID=A0A0K2T3S7_LEPSM